MNSYQLPKFIILWLILLFPAYVNAKYTHPEKWYNNKYCNGKIEYIMPDRTRCDCLTDTHAIEYDFGKKWAEAIGQSLYYSLQTGRRAGIVLIIDDPEEIRYWIRLNSTIIHFKLPIDTWKVHK